MANAIVRARPLYVAVSSDSEVGDIMAPPRPCNARAAINA